MNPSTASPLPAVQASNPAEQIARAGRREAGLRVILPLALIALLLVAWEAIVRINQIPHYILPAPTLVLRTLFEQWHSLAPSLWFTVKLTLMALAAAVVGGVLLAMAFALSKWVEIGLFPLAVVMQVTPIVAIAPLILIYADLRLDRGFLSHPVQYGDWSQERGQ